MSEERPLNVAAWLSEVSSSPDPSPDSQTQDTPTKISQKRKRPGDHQSGLPQQQSQLRQPLTRTALAELSLNIMNTPSPSVGKRAAKKIKNPITPRTDTSKRSYDAASRPPTTTPGGSSSSKQTPNEDNVRLASARQGMFFEDEESYEKYPEFKTHIENMVFGNRGSAMRTESIQSIKTWRIGHATKDEKTYFAGIVPKIFKEARNAPVPKKRTFQGEVVLQVKSFQTDGLDERQDCPLVKNLLPLRTAYADASAQGVTNAKPDFVYGLECPRFPDPDEPVLSAETMAEIEVAPGLQHAFFSVDNKCSQQSIEAAENQAMRSGATMVRARRFLNRKANGKVWVTMPENQASGIETIPNDPSTADDVATGEPSNITADAMTNSIARGPQTNETEQEDLGADTSSYAFTCSWVPQLANIHVHWCERRPGGSEIYHMNLLRGYLMSDNGHVSDFRKDVHNILDWGVSSRRKEILKQLERDIAKYESLSG